MHRDNAVPKRDQLGVGKSSLETVTPLIGADLQKQRAGIDSLAELYSQIESFLDSLAHLRDTDPLALQLWENFCAHQQLLEATTILRDRVSTTIEITSNFKPPKNPSRSITHMAEALGLGIGNLTSLYIGLTKQIKDSGLNSKLDYNNIPHQIQMLQRVISEARQDDTDKEQIGQGQVPEELGDECDDWENIDS